MPVGAVLVPVPVAPPVPVPVPVPVHVPCINPAKLPLQSAAMLAPTQNGVLPGGSWLIAEASWQGHVYAYALESSQFAVVRDHVRIGDPPFHVTD